MADRADKIVAIFGNPMVLNQVLDDLNQSGFNRDEISVLMKNHEGLDNDVTGNDVRTYSAGGYPSATLERPSTTERLGDKVDRGLDHVGNSLDRGLDRVGMDRAGDSLNRGLDRVGDTFDRDNSNSNLGTPGRDFITPNTPITGVDAGTAYNNTESLGSSFDNSGDLNLRNDVSDVHTTRIQDSTVHSSNVHSTNVHGTGINSGLQNPGVYDTNTVQGGHTDPRHEELIGDKVNVNRETDLQDRHDVSVKDPNALIKDSTKGGILGLLAGAAALLIPGIGPVMAAGPIAAAIGALATGAAIGTSAGALVGLFKDEGIPSDRVDAYRSAFDAGKAIVIIKPKNEQDEMTELNMARSILNRYNPEMVELIS